MATRKLYTVNLGGKERALRYSQLHGVAIQRKTGKSPREIIHGVPVDQDARLALLVAGLAPPFQGGRWKVAALINYIDANFDEVGGWLDDAIAEGRPLGPIFDAVAFASYASGMALGVSFDLEAAMQAAKDEEAQGKAPAASETAPG